METASRPRPRLALLTIGGVCLVLGLFFIPIWAIQGYPGSNSALLSGMSLAISQGVTDIKIISVEANDSVTTDNSEYKAENTDFKTPIKSNKNGVWKIKYKATGLLSGYKIIIKADPDIAELNEVIKFNAVGGITEVEKTFDLDLTKLGNKKFDINGRIVDSENKDIEKVALKTLVKIDLIKKPLVITGIEPAESKSPKASETKLIVRFTPGTVLDDKFSGKIFATRLANGSIEVLEEKIGKALKDSKDGVEVAFTDFADGEYFITIPKFNPTSTLEQGPGFKDIYGNVLEKDFQFRFKREIKSAADPAKPTIMSFTGPGQTAEVLLKDQPSKTNKPGDWTVKVRTDSSQIGYTIFAVVNNKNFPDAGLKIIDGKVDYPITVPLANETQNVISAFVVKTENGLTTNGPRADEVKIDVLKKPLDVESVDPSFIFGQKKVTQEFTFRFAAGTKLDKTRKGQAALAPIVNQAVGPAETRNIETPTDSTVKVVFGGLEAGNHQIVLKKTPSANDGPMDVYGNQLENDKAFIINCQGPDADSPDSRNLRDTGDQILYPEYMKPRFQPAGFNPEDRVETRVARLYFYRDAHRVVQIINRSAKSYNRAAVDVQRQIASKKRDYANMKTDERRSLERVAVQKAMETRALETQIANLNAQYQNALIEPNSQLADMKVAQALVKKQIDDLTLENASVVTRKKPLEDANASFTAAQVVTATARTDEDRVRSAQRDADKAKIDASMDTQADKDTKKRLIDDAFNAKTAEIAAKRAREDAPELAKKAARDNDLNTLNSFQKNIADNLAALNLASPEAIPVGGGLSEAQTTLKKIEDAQRDKVKEINELSKQLQKLREVEIAANEAALSAQAVEDRAREEQFRREVAAAMEDPDTYAPGKIDSSDFIAQVSLAVIGEGLVQMRGPVKGINAIRLAIHQIDTPVGQTRISVHTVQINGERGDRMEKVSRRIQTYLDQSRFLTTQSAQMLRKAIIRIASERALSHPPIPGVQPGSQMDRDYRYLVAFFGLDFIRELQTLDSEFLQTGNKLLSLNSMDSTSLASALFLVTLAKNDIRRDIILEFERLMQCEMPTAEHNYISALAADCDRHLGHKGQYQILSLNARFESIKGFLNADVAAPDGLNPTQREFLRLAQIFKSQLITELELRQRVMERAMIEERIAGVQSIDTNQEVIDLAGKEKLAKNAYDAAVIQLNKNKPLFFGKLVMLREGVRDLNAAKKEEDKRKLEELKIDLRRAWERERVRQDIEERNKQLAWERDRLRKLNEEKNGRGLKALMTEGPKISAIAKKYSLTENSKLFDLPKIVVPDSGDSVAELSVENGPLDEMLAVIEKIFPSVFNADEKTKEFLENLFILKKMIGDYDVGNPDSTLHRIIADFDKTALDFTSNVSEAENTLIQIQKNRQPIDHKKILDMLVSEMEDKYIDLLEGTRAHTANIDNYIKTLVTALDDDFNRQFYQPAFSSIRSASRFYDVSLGQVDTTTVLANNRGFAKVDPQATMEFDLPRRDILIQEAFKSGKALVQDYGALLQDPTFLSLGKLGSGSPTGSMAAGTGGALSPVRNVLPGLPGTSSEAILAQQGPGDRELGAALEALIPDPAIYKFETGTGYEIRPVIQPDGQAVVFNFNYMYTTNVREPVRADEKHLGRIKRHFIRTDVQLSNFELREVSTYTVALKAARTAKGVPLLEDVPGVGILFRPLASDESSLQQNKVYAQATIFPTLFDLMGLRWAPAVADLDALRLQNQEFVVRNRRREIQNRAFDISSSRVDDFLRTPLGDRRPDNYRSQESIPSQHPNGYSGPGLNYRDSQMRPGYQPGEMRPGSSYIPSENPEGSNHPPRLTLPPNVSPLVPGNPGVRPDSGYPGPGNVSPLVPGNPGMGPFGGYRSPGTDAPIQRDRSTLPGAPVTVESDSREQAQPSRSTGGPSLGGGLPQPFSSPAPSSPSRVPNLTNPGSFRSPFDGSQNRDSSSPKPESKPVSNRGNGLETPNVLPTGFGQPSAQPKATRSANTPAKTSSWGLRNLWGKPAKPSDKPVENATSPPVVPAGYQQVQPAPDAGSDPSASLGREAKDSAARTSRNSKPSAFAGLFPTSRKPSE